MYQPFAVMGYDKAHDIYAMLCIVRSTTFLPLIAELLTHYHLNEQTLRRNRIGEPFDHFVTTDINGNIDRIYTEEFPKGHELFNAAVTNT